MILAHVSPWLKLWDKGVDISATVAANTLTAIIALLGWRAKLWLDEQKQIQTAKIDDRLAAEKKARARQERVANMKMELATFIGGAGSITTDQAARQLAWRYLAWLDETRLTRWRQNLDLVHKWQAATFSTQGKGLPGSMTLDHVALRRFSDEMSQTEIPDSTDAEFGW